MTEFCDLCRSTELIPVYQATGSTRGLDVHVCFDCGLVQSLPRMDRAARSAAAISSGADWGNVRYGKAFRTEACLLALRAHADVSAPLRVLDVGSNRGSFAKSILAQAPRVNLVCVEPDERVAESCAGLPRTELVRARIEETCFSDSSFDVVHSCHTIEHLASPVEVLAEHWRVLKPGGLLVVDAPNIALIGGDDIVEEWFIDKHLYHFSAATLRRLIEQSGFAVLSGPDPKDQVNLLFTARKARKPAREAAPAREEAEAALGLIISYVNTRARNLTALTYVATQIAQFAPKRVAVWGAGRLFDALVLHGGLNTKSLAALVDTHLKAHMPERHGMTLSEPESLSAVAPDVIIVMSRSFAGEIADAARRVAPKADILLYTDLLANARMQKAA